MAIQIFGTKKCRDTQKTLRYLSERRIPFHFVDLNVKAMSKGELMSIAKSVPMEELIDRESKEFRNRKLKYIGHNIEEALLEFPLMIKTPVLRNGKEACIGYHTDILNRWIKDV